MAAVGDSMQLYRDWQQMFKELLEDSPPPCMMNMWSAMKGRLEQVDHGLLMIMLRCLDKGEFLGPAQMKHAELMCADDILDGILVEYLFHVHRKGDGMMDMERFQTGIDMMGMEQMRLYYNWMQWGMDDGELGDIPLNWITAKESLEQVDHGLLMIMLCRMDKGEYLTAELTKDIEHMSKDELIEVMMPYFYHVPGLGVGKGMTGKGELAVVPYPPPIDLYDEAKVARAAASKGKDKGQQQKKRRLGSDDVGTILEMELAEGTLEEDSDGDDSDGDAINDDAGTILEMETEENENEEEDDVGTILEMETEEGVGSDDGQDGVVYVGDEPKFPDEPELLITIEPYIAGQFKPFTIMIEENFRIIGIKARIGEVLEASTRQMRLFMGEELLVDNMKLSSYGNPNGARLRLAVM
jgi:hypothetical protein